MRSILIGELRFSPKEKRALPMVWVVLGPSLRSRRTTTAFQRSSTAVTRAFLTRPATLSIVFVSSITSPTRKVSSLSGTK